MSIQRTVSRYKSRLNWDDSKWEEIAKIGKDILQTKADKKAKRGGQNATTNTENG